MVYVAKEEMSRRGQMGRGAFGKVRKMLRTAIPEGGFEVYGTKVWYGSSSRVTGKVYTGIMVTYNPGAVHYAGHNQRTLRTLVMHELAVTDQENAIQTVSFRKNG